VHYGSVSYQPHLVKTGICNLPFFLKIPSASIISVIQHRDLIGRTERGFDFLGYHFGPEGLTDAQKTLGEFVERATRLYEQEPGEPFVPSGSGSTQNGGQYGQWRVSGI